MSQREKIKRSACQRKFLEYTAEFNTKRLAVMNQSIIKLYFMHHAPRDLWE